MQLRTTTCGLAQTLGKQGMVFTQITAYDQDPLEL